MFNTYIRERQNEIIESVIECVKIKSVRSEAEEGMPFGKGVNDALEFVLNKASEMGFRAVNIDNMAGYAEYGDGEEMIAVLGHIDVVPEGDGWTYDPWGEVVNDRLYGRGTLDDKGPVIGALYALDAVRTMAGDLKRRIRIIFGTDEETGSSDMKRYNQTEETPVMGFTPDADYPVIFSEKGIARIVLEKGINDGSLLYARGGKAVNIVPDYAEIKYIGQSGEIHTLDAKGAPAHGSTPHLGKNAVSDILKNAGDIAGDFKTFVDFYNKYINDETDGKSLGINHKSEKFGSTTVNTGILEGGNNFVKVVLDCRYPADETFETKVKNAELIAEKHEIKCELISNVKPLYIPEDSELVSTLQEVYIEQTGQILDPVVIGGGTYAKAVKNIVAFGPVFPDQDNVIHQKDEYISIENLMKNVEIMAHAMYRLAK